MSGNDSKRILIVDDDLDLLMVAERRLLKEGYAVETAASLPEAEELIFYFEPHLVLLDINVAGEDGRTLSMKLKQSSKRPSPKIVMMSGYDYNASRAALFGADELLVKPLIGDFLLYRIAVHLGEKDDQTALSFSTTTE